MRRAWALAAILGLGIAPAAQADSLRRLLSYQCDPSAGLLAVSYRSAWNEKGDALIGGNRGNGWPADELVVPSEKDGDALTPMEIEQRCVLNNTAYRVTLSAAPQGRRNGACGAEIGGVVGVMTPTGQSRRFELEQGECHDMARPIIVHILFYAGATEPVVSTIPAAEFFGNDGFTGFTAGFPCGHARSGSERLVCFNPDLAALDLNMTRMFRDRLDHSSPPEQQALVKSQRAWLRQRDRECLPAPARAGDKTGAEITACLRKSYRDRLAVLGAPPQPRPLLP